MAVAPDLDPVWTTSTGTAGQPTAAFSPQANSLVIIDAVCDSNPTGITASIVDSVGLTWTPIGTVQSGTSGGSVASWWAYTIPARTNMTATVTWAGTGVTQAKGIKTTTWLGTASASAVLAKAQGASATNNLTVTVTNTNDQCRISAVAVDWNALGLPVSTDTEVAFHTAGGIDGIAVYKAANTTGTGTSVSINFDAGGTAAAGWAYNVYEIVPAAGGGSSFTATQTDPAGLTDAASAVSAFGRAQTETAGLVDSTSTAAAYARTQDDVAGLTDLASPVALYARTVGDPAGLTDSAATAIVYARSVDDPAGLTDAATGTLATPATTSTLFGATVPTLTDAADGATNYVLATRFTPGRDGWATHGRWYFPATIPSPTDRAQIAIYTVGTGVELGRAAFPLTATLGAWNTVAFTVPIHLSAGTEYEVGYYTPLRYVATPTYTWPFTSGDLTASATNGYLAVNPGGLAFATTASGNSASYFADLVFDPNLQAGAVDIVGLTDATTVTFTAGSALSPTVDDLAGLTDTTTVAVDYSQTATDAVGLADTATATASYSRTQGDSVGLVDSVTSQLTPAGTAYTRTVDDPMGLTDTGSPMRVDVVDTVTDPAGLTDTASTAIAYARTVDDPVGLVDTTSAAQAGAGTRQVDDTVGLTDVVTVQATYSRTITDLAGLTDATVTQTAGAGTRQVDDSAGMTDTVTVQVTYAITVDDTVGLLDAVLATSPQTTVTDVLGLTDTVVPVLTAIRIVTDTVGLTDTATIGELVVPGRRYTTTSSGGPRYTTTSGGAHLAATSTAP